jgi:hypothetical protein
MSGRFTLTVADRYDGNGHFSGYDDCTTLDGTYSVSPDGSSGFESSCRSVWESNLVIPGNERYLRNPIEVDPSSFTTPANRLTRVWWIRRSGALPSAHSARHKIDALNEIRLVQNDWYELKREQRMIRAEQGTSVKKQRSPLALFSANAEQRNGAQAH